jgi:hypothetical protein
MSQGTKEVAEVLENSPELAYLARRRGVELPSGQ